MIFVFSVQCFVFRVSFLVRRCVCVVFEFTFVLFRDSFCRFRFLFVVSCVVFRCFAILGFSILVFSCSFSCSA